jgi:hypothetical protein
MIAVSSKYLGFPVKRGPPTYERPGRESMRR